MSWISGKCRDCGDDVIGSQATEKNADVWWYCSNKMCKNHDGAQSGDQDEPDWIKFTSTVGEGVRCKNCGFQIEGAENGSSKIKM